MQRGQAHSLHPISAEEPQAIHAIGAESRGLNQNTADALQARTVSFINTVNI